MLRDALCCARWNFCALKKNPRTWMCLLLGLLLCWLLTDKTMAVSREFKTNVQLCEPFVWCFADGDSVLYASLALTLLLSEFPRLDASAAPLIFRAGRRAWLLGQLLTVLTLTLGYCAMMLACSMLLCAGGNAAAGNRWSETATLLSYAPENFEAALKVMRGTVKLTTPWGCALRSLLLLFLYVLLLSFMQLACAVRRSRRSGIAAVMAVSFAGFVLTPDRLMSWLQLPEGLRYFANVLAVWLSPLQHAAYAMHNFGYGLLPRIGTSCLILGGGAAILAVSALLTVRQLPFNFSGGDSDDG